MKMARPIAPGTVACSAVELQSALNEMFKESIDSVIERESSALGSLLQKSDGKCVLFGAGSLGSQALELLRSIQVEPLAMADNDPRRWGQVVAGIPILSPSEAAALHGKHAVFFITIRNENHWFTQTVDQLEQLGCRLVSSADPFAWLFPEKLRPALLYDKPHKLYQQADRVLNAAELWEDDVSRALYLNNVRLRAHGDRTWFASPAPGESYFLPGIFETSPTDTFLDCGAFDGDTIRILLAHQPEWAAIHAIEAAPVSFARMEEYVTTLERGMQERIHLYPCAVGAEQGTIRFENSGTAASTIAASGGTEVTLSTMDNLFASSSLSIVKMDIEGAEADALIGGREIIRRDNPILFICAYHKQGDIWDLPLLMRELCPDSKLYLRTHGGDAIQTVAYAVPPGRVLSNSDQLNS